MSKRILVIDDDHSMREFLKEDLDDAKFDVITRSSAALALEFMASNDVDAVVTDLNMKGMGGVELCRQIALNRPGLPVIVITAFGTMETAIEAMRAGAYDFVAKPFDTEVLALALERAISHSALRDEVRRLRQSVAASQGFGKMLGNSPVMHTLYKMLARIADSDASVLIHGETGTGKELVARGLHDQSHRKTGPFLALNCAAVPVSLLESELFGHAKGAFTDARTSRVGVFEQAHGGTLFLDEIGEMPLEMQPKLLRALQERTIRPVGGNNDVAIDVRVIGATNRDLDEAVTRGAFRRDLLYRINVITVELPALRLRGNDILLLAQTFIERASARQNRNVVGLSSTAAEKLLAYEWPGNVRELENVIERALTLAEHDKILPEDLPEKIRNYRTSQIVLDTGDPDGLVTLDEIERRYVTRVFQAVSGNKAQAARILGVDRKTLYRKLEKHGLASGEFVPTADDP